MLKYPDLFAPEAPANGLEVFSRMRSDDPIYYLNTDFFNAWLVTSYCRAWIQRSAYMESPSGHARLICF
jgi:hypothetical protein